MNSFNPAAATTEYLPDLAEQRAGGKYDYIDAVRGWAILLVITCHVGGRFAEMPYPVKKLTNFGWHGVQMFFLASAVTLMMSWNRQKEDGLAKTGPFFIRRFLRIAPMYYIGALFYFVVEPPESGFNLLQMLRTFLFVNSWRPDWIPTTPGWTVVPGGWSIGVEFTFYAVFPMLAAVLTTLPRALAFVAASLICAGCANYAGMSWFSGYEPEPLNNFLYFWFPNQLPVFALGIVLYHLITLHQTFIRRQRWVYVPVAAVIFACVLVAEYPTSPSWFHSFTSVPPILLATLLFMIFIFTLAKGVPTLFLHPWIRRAGVLSFSAYVLHFYFVASIPGWTGGLLDIKATGVTAIGMLAVFWVLTIIATLVASHIAHALIERPGIRLASRLTARRRVLMQTVAR